MLSEWTAKLVEAPCETANPVSGSVDDVCVWTYKKSRATPVEMN